jgi:hypothetical protein
MTDKKMDNKFLFERLIEAASFKPASIQRPYSWVGHIPFLSWLIEVTQPKIFVELGVHTGNSYFTACQTVRENNMNCSCFAIDTWKGDEHSGSYDGEIYQTVLQHNNKEYQSFSKLLRMKFDEAVSHFPDNSINLLHIDGLHTYEAVKHDFETYLPKMAIGGIVLFHDTKVMNTGFGVHKFWKELQTRYPLNFEFDHSHGLGVLQLNNCNEQNRINWLEAKSSERVLLKKYFSSLGFYLLRQKELQGIIADRNQKIDRMIINFCIKLKNSLKKFILSISLTRK